MATSTIPAFKAALFARLQADTGLGAASPPVLVTYGLPKQGQRDLPREWVFVGNTRSEDPTNGESPYRGGQSTGAMGQLRREERYVLEVIVSVTGPGVDGQQPCTERAFVIAGLVETSLRTWQAQANAIDLVVRWALVTGLEHKEGVTENGDHSCTATIDVACAARI
jgi:hypothetical protein